MFNTANFSAEIILTACLAALSLHLMYSSLNDMVGDKIRGAIKRHRNKTLPPNTVALQAKHDAILAVIQKHNNQQRNAYALYQIRRLNRRMDALGIKDRSFEVK